MRIADVLWAGEVEPRLLELLPALLVKRPALFGGADALPKDLEMTVHALRRNREPEPFRGIEGHTIAKWLPHVGHKQKLPSQLKTFRLQRDDIELLEQLQRKLGGSRTGILRRALRALDAQQSRASR